MKKYIPQLFVIVIVAYLLFLIRHALLGQLTGTFKSHPIPSDYTMFNSFIDNQSQFFRTFWIPTTQRFGQFSLNHPTISGYEFFHVASPSGIINFLHEASTEKTLQESSVRYIIVPYDSEGEIFLKDRKYDDKLYKQTVKDVQRITWLKEIIGFGKIHIFEVSNPKDHFFLTGKGSVTYTFINPTKYEVTLHNAEKGELLVFSESYDKYWIASTIGSKPYDRLFNSFILPKDGTYSFVVEYTPQRLVSIGLWISGISLVGVLGILIWLGRRKMLK